MKLTFNNLRVEVRGKFSISELLLIFERASEIMKEETGATWDIHYGDISNTNWTPRQAKKNILSYVLRARKEFILKKRNK